MPERVISDSAIYSAVPTVRVDSQANDKVTELLLAMVMSEHAGGLSSLELRLSNVASDTRGGADLAFDDDAVLKLGATIAVHAGDRAAPTEIFRGKITALEACFENSRAPELVVLAEDALQAARMTRRTRVHERKSPADIARDIATASSLTPKITGLDAPVDTWAQVDESDLAFLRRVLQRCDGDCQVVADELHVSARGDVRRGEIELDLNSQLRRARVIADLAHQVSEVTVAGWDPVQGARVSATSRGAHLSPGAGHTGAQVVQAALNSRSEHVGELAVSTDAEARSVADAVFDSRARRFVRVHGTAEGNPALRVGTHVKLRGLGLRFDNTYYVVRTWHRFDQEHGYLTEFEGECAYFGSGR